VKNKYTFLIIPPHHGRTRQFQFTLGGKRILISGLFTLGVFILGLLSYNFYLSNTLQAQEAAFRSVKELKDANQAKDQEIQYLKAESQAMSQDLARIQELELKISSILKIEPTASQLSQRGDTLPTPSIDPINADSVSKKLSLIQDYHELVLKNEEKINHTPSILPLEGEYEISSSFGYRRNPFGRFTNEYHNGVDFACDYGTPVRATAAGTVTYSGWDSVYGRKVEIDHGSGIITFYGHNSKLVVKNGDTVQKGDLIAYSGNSGRSTGSHLHYGAFENGKSIDPLRFTQFIKEQ
jgi:murein DD-endopeptidase MepM/ murein hydrolase activator NlpD